MGKNLNPNDFIDNTKNSHEIAEGTINDIFDQF